jgi:tellurite resistance protein
MNTFVTVDDAPQLAGTTLQPCKDNQYRSEETNRCRTIVATAVSVPCKDGQYRSEETNRCRNIALAGSTLVACGDDQYRSEATNRCRNIVTLTGTLTPCKDNQYRSEETNRCRNITTSTVPAAAFAVESTPDTGKVFVGWYALGGVGALAVAYGVWEWRSEAMAAVRRIASFFTKQ